MSHIVSVRHNFETAHRLPHLGGKCTNIHGHSWWVEVTITAPERSSQGTVTEFGGYKKLLRDWIDTHLDHGAMLGHTDPLVPAFISDGSKLFQFGAEGSIAADMGWPTVENVAVLLSRVAQHCLDQTVSAPGAQVTAVDVQEKHDNRGGWRA